MKDSEVIKETQKKDKEKSEKKSEKRILRLLDTISNYFEIGIAFLLLIVIVVRVIEVTASVMGHELIILATPFESIMSLAFSLVIGVELVKMLSKHTPETVIDVLLFATARQAIMYYESIFDMLIGVAAIGGLFAIKKYLIHRSSVRVVETVHTADSEK